MRWFKTILKWLAALFLCGAVISNGWDYLERQKGAAFASCNVQTFDKTTVEQARAPEGILPFDQVQAMNNIANDECMARRGYKFTGGDDLRFCGLGRIWTCYSRW
jgi:predicted negative regulator of RcsB-dependent stress response